MQTLRPDFLGSEYFYINKYGWQLREDAPDELKESFKKYMEQVSHPSEPEDHIYQLLSNIKKYIKMLTHNEVAFDLLEEKNKKLVAVVERLISLISEQTQKNLLENIEPVQSPPEEIEPLHSLENEQTQKKKPTGKEFGHGVRPNRLTPDIMALIYNRRSEKVHLSEIRKEIKKLWGEEFSLSTISRIFKAGNEIIDF